MALLSATSAASPLAAEPSFTLFADCDLGKTCYIQQYVDSDPGPGARDYTCGALSYDGHKGTDLALPSLAALAEDVNVIAAAPGRVQGARDGVADGLMPDEGDDRPACGNGVAIDHGDGWVTQYCHMRRGSIAVRTGDVVDRGAVLGKIGLSGRTQFPHVHMSVRHNDQVVDPFAASGGCGGGAPRSLWDQTPPYLPTGMIALGFSDQVPAFDDIRSGVAAEELPGRDAPALVLWAYGYGGAPGDRLAFAIDGPQGQVIETEVTLDKRQILFFQAAGRKLAQGLAPGAYTGRVTLTRDGKVDETRETTFTLR